jgi:hypothetical protein
MWCDIQPSLKRSLCKKKFFLLQIIIINYDTSTAENLNSSSTFWRFLLPNTTTTLLITNAVGLLDGILKKIVHENAGSSDLKSRPNVPLDIPVVCFSESL